MVFFGKVSGKFLEEYVNVFLLFLQWWYIDGYCIQVVVNVFLEFVFFYCFQKGDIGSCNDMYICFVYFGGVYMDEFFGFQYMQQKRLCIYGYFVDFIQENCIVIVGFKVFFVFVCCFGEGFFFMFKQF